MKLFVLSILTLVLVTSCRNTEYERDQTFIGAYRGLDKMIPYSYILQKKKDSIYLFNNRGVKIDSITNHKIELNEVLNFKNKKLKILKKKADFLHIFDLLDTTNFRVFNNGKPSIKHVAKFQKLTTKNTFDVLKIKDNLKNNIWNLEIIKDENINPNNDLEINQLLNFKEDSLNIITNYYYKGLKTVSETETKSYSVFNIDSLYFLSFQKQIDNPQPIYQIVNYNSGKISLKDFSSEEIKTIHFKKENISQDEYLKLLKESSLFSNCFDGYQGEYYFNDNDVTYNKGNTYLLEYVKVNAPTTETQSGYIIIHFNVSCNKAVGKFGLIQMNREFQEVAFSKEMVNHLINKVSKLSDFPDTYSNMVWLNYKDVHAFLMFKLENGKIVDLCP